MLVAIFEYLDRISLEKLEHACRRFRTIVDSKMTNVCYRVIDCINIRYTFQFGKRRHCVRVTSQYRLEFRCDTHEFRRSPFVQSLFQKDRYPIPIL